MCKIYRRVTTIWILCLLALRASAQIDVTPAQTAQQLAQKLVGAGITMLNPHLTCPSQANGTFTINGPDLGIDSGIVLTTGRAQTQNNKYGVNGASAFLASTNNNFPGDPVLDSLAGQATLDACALEFDLIPNGDTVKFNYVFSSEEYINAVCGPYNDAFGFFISGPGISGQQNMALVPGTNIPVTINSINNGVPGAGNNIANCTSMGPGSPFTNYYKDNTLGLLLTHKGLTTVLQAQHAVMPCSTYHLKMVIADGGNALYDSGVFLEAGSLQSSSLKVRALSELPPPVPNAAFAVKGCLPGAFRVRKPSRSLTQKTVHYLVGGTAVSGLDYIPLPDSVVIPAGDTTADVIIHGIATTDTTTKMVKLYVEPEYNCTGLQVIVDSATLTLYDTGSLHVQVPNVAICARDVVQLQISGPGFYDYSWTPSAGLSSDHVQRPFAAPMQTTTYLVKASLPGTNCEENYGAVTVMVKPSPTIVPPTTVTGCQDKSLTLRVQVVPDSLNYSYAWSGPGGFAPAAAMPVLPSLQISDAGDYHVTVTNAANGCADTATLLINVDAPPAPLVVSPLVVCQYSVADTLTALGENLLWYNGAAHISGSNVAPTPPTDAIATYQYLVTQTINGCESGADSIVVAVKKCCDGVVFVPTAFTPNNDGLNDFFHVRMDYGYSVKKFQVYNRWGQLVFDTQSNNAEWDGRFNGQPADMGTYFYDIELNCIDGGTVIRKGEVTLVR